MSSSFTCISCRVVFQFHDMQKEHYKTEWHRYNLRRKIVNLPPVTEDVFQKKVNERQNLLDFDAKGVATYCNACKKSFTNYKTFESHANSKKHKESVLGIANEDDMLVSQPLSELHNKKIIPMEEDIEEDSEIEEVDSDEWDEDFDKISDYNPILNNVCLFCKHNSIDQDTNMQHMKIEHSFFIPELDYVTDLNKLLLFLGEKVCRFYMCLWCNFSGKMFSSMKAAQKHMRDKGHCKMLYEGTSVSEYEDYYNFASSYPDHNESTNIDEEIEILELDGNAFELKLPSGNTIGHRSLFHYYKQSFAPHLMTTRSSKSQKMFAKYKSIGGLTQEDKKMIERKIRDTRFMKKLQSKYYTQLGVKANKLQKHFRAQILM